MSNGFFFVLDRTNGKNLVTSRFVESPNWFKGVNQRGEPIPDPEKDSQLGGSLISPNNGGAANWTPPTYDPDTELFYLNTAQGYEIHYQYPRLWIFSLPFKWFWRKTDFEGFWGALLVRDLTYAKLYQDWET